MIIISIRTKRITEIKNYIYEHKTVSLDQLCEVFDVSKNTIRRDIQSITQNSDIKKVYGGVSVMQNKRLVAFEQRSTQNATAKQEIAKKAAELVEDGDIIFVDSGTTTSHMADYLKDKKDLIILTNNLEFISKAIPYENLKIISLSGLLNRETLSFTGENATMVMETFNINKAFLATTGISITYGVTNSSQQESIVKQCALKRSYQSILLADASKFGAVSLISYCQFNKPDIIITNAKPPAEYVAGIKRAGHQLIVTD